MKRKDQRDVVGLDPWPKKRPALITIQDTPQGVFAVASPSGKRLLKLMSAGEYTELVAQADIGRSLKSLVRGVQSH